MTVLSVTENIYNLFWQTKNWPSGLLLVGIGLVVVGVICLVDSQTNDFVFALVPLGCGLIICLSLYFTGNREEYKIPYNSYEVALDESVGYLDPINDDFKIERKDGETAIFTVTPRVETANVPTFTVGEYINTKEYVNNESN